MSLGGGEILVILLVALIVFGPTRLPDVARQVGKAMREVRKMQDSVKREIHGALNTDDEHETNVAVPTYDEHQTPPGLDPEAHRGEPPPPPHFDSAGPEHETPSAGSFS